MSQTESRLFFLVSGEHPELPQAEVKAILESENIPYRVIGSGYRLIILESSSRALGRVADRSLMTELCGHVVSEIQSGSDSIAKIPESQNLTSFLSEGESFSVRSVRIAGGQSRMRRVQLERDLGKLIAKERQGVRVNLNNPSKTFLAILTPDKALLGLITNAREKGVVSRRRPRKRPYFHPSTMQPKLARCMVNLARPRPGEILLDPFCGIGGHLIEAGLMGCRVVGVDVKRRMLRAANRNLAFFGVKAEGLLLGDARKLPLSLIQSIATDPPYGRGASTIGATPRDLLTAFLAEITGVLGEGAFVCLAAAKETGALDIGRECGFEVVENYDIYVHRNLTRRLVVFKWK